MENIGAFYLGGANRGNGNAKEKRQPDVYHRLIREAFDNLKKEITLSSQEEIKLRRIIDNKNFIEEINKAWSGKEFNSAGSMEEIDAEEKKRVLYAKNRLEEMLGRLQ